MRTIRVNLKMRLNVPLHRSFNMRLMIAQCALVRPDTVIMCKHVSLQIDRLYKVLVAHHAGKRTLARVITHMQLIITTISKLFILTNMARIWLLSGM